MYEHISSCQWCAIISDALLCHTMRSVKRGYLLSKYHCRIEALVASVVNSLMALRILLISSHRYILLHSRIVRIG